MSQDPGMGLVIGMGLGTVFIGLICIIAICYIMGAVIRALESRRSAEEKPAADISDTPVESVPEENRGELIAAISAAIAEELGTGVEAIRITSIKKVK